MRRTAFEASIAKRANVERMEMEGKISDTDAVRLELLDRMTRGDITLEEMKKELEKVKRDGKKKGLLTKQQAYSRG